MRKIAEHSLVFFAACAFATGWNMFLPWEGAQYATLALAVYVAAMVAWKA